MSEAGDRSQMPIDFILPNRVLLYENNETLDFVLAKPKLLPLKSIGLQKLERMQRDADAKMKTAQESVVDQAQALKDK